MFTRATFAALAAVAALLSGCAQDTGRIVNVAPSAHGQIELIAAAVDTMNARAGTDSWSVRMVDHEHRIDDQIIVRQWDAPKGEINGYAEPTRWGVIIHIRPDCWERVVVHELGHAAGLGHVDDRNNLMAEDVSASEDEWTLTEEQIDRLR